MAMMGQEIQKRPYQIKAFSGHIRNLENRTYPLTDKLCRSIDSVFAGFYEDRNFSCPGRLEYSSQLGNRLLQNLRWADVDLGNDYHDRDIKCHSDSEMLSVGIKSDIGASLTM